MKRWIPALVLFLGTAACAKDIDGQYAVHGIGSVPCNEYLMARQSGGGAQLEYEVWMAGYFSAFNLIVANTYSIMGDRSTVHFLDALDEYCSANPGELFVQAMASITMVVFPERLNLSPHVDRWPSLLDEVKPSDGN